MVPLNYTALGALGIQQRSGKAGEGCAFAYFSHFASPDARRFSLLVSLCKMSRAVCFGYLLSRLFSVYPFRLKRILRGINKYSGFRFEAEPQDLGRSFTTWNKQTDGAGPAPNAPYGNWPHWREPKGGAGAIQQ
jgi:hypothetical protein